MKENGQLSPKKDLENIDKLIESYFNKIDINDKTQLVKFGTSGHRGNPYKNTFNEMHILAISQAICDYRKQNNINGALFIGIDSHALSLPARQTAMEVFSANNIKIIIDSNQFTPTPVISHNILTYNQINKNKADGIIITPSHNPPSDGGFKYNPPHGGPAQSEITTFIENRANEIIKNNLNDVKRDKTPLFQKIDLITPYVENLHTIIDIESIKNSNIKIGVDPLGGSSICVYKKIKEILNINFEFINDKIDSTFYFVPLDHDLKIRMDCSSKYVMNQTLKYKDKFDIILSNDTDADRHAIITNKGGLINPNHYLSVAIWYLFQYRDWSNKKVGKTIVSSSMIDRVVNFLNKELFETPVGFKFFAKGLFETWLGFGGEESAGASFLTKEQKPFSTDKDGIIMTLLAVEIMSKLKDISLIYQELEEKFGKFYYERIDLKTDNNTKTKIKTIDISNINIEKFAGDKIEKIITKINNESIGGIKIYTKNGWVAIRPSGTEDILKIYTESFKSKEHLVNLQNDAKQLLNNI